MEEVSFEEFIVDIRLAGGVTGLLVLKETAVAIVGVVILRVQIVARTVLVRIVSWERDGRNSAGTIDAWNGDGM